MSQQEIIEEYPSDQHLNEAGVEQFVSPNVSMKDVTDGVLAPIENKFTLGWWIGLAISLALLGILAFSLTTQL